MAEINRPSFSTFRSTPYPEAIGQQELESASHNTEDRSFKGHSLTSCRPQKSISEANTLYFTNFTENPYRNLLNVVENEIGKAGNQSAWCAAEVKKEATESYPYPIENKLAEHQIKSEHCVFPWLSSWDFFTPSPTHAWVFPATGQMVHHPGNSTTTQVLPPPTHPTLRLRFPPPLAQQHTLPPPKWGEFNNHLNRVLGDVFKQLPNRKNGQDVISTLYWDIYKFSLLCRDGDISQEDICELNNFIRRSDTIRGKEPQTEASEALRNLSYLLRGICFSQKCHHLLSAIHSDRNPEKRCQQLMEELIRLDTNNQVLAKWRKAITTMQAELQSRQLSHSMSSLSLIQRPDAPPESTPQGAIGGIGISERPPRATLLQETEKLMKERHEVADSLRKVDQRTPEGQQKYAKLDRKLQALSKRIDQNIEIYHRCYGQETWNRIQRWCSSATSALATEGSATIQGLRDLQSQIESAIDEIELFFDKKTHHLCRYTWNQLTDALNRIQSAEDFLRVRRWINNDQAIIPNQVRPGDDQPLYFLFQELSQELDNQICIFSMPDVSDQEREQARINIVKATKRLDKIIEVFRTVVHRYERLKSDHQYPHQLAEMEEASRKGHRVTATAPSPKIQERLLLIKTLNNPSIDTNHLLDMSDEDFQLIFNLLGGKQLTDENRKTMTKNSWQLTEGNNLMTQRGHERVTVVAIGSLYQLIDTASNTTIGTLDRVRWERIHKRLEREGLRGAVNITRQMVLDDFRDFPTTEEQLQAQRAEGIGGFLDTVRQQGGVIVPNPVNNERPDDQPVSSEILRHQRRYYQRP
ncbi:hypothetical protein [Endozoicomonas atrinae]|uniref:hypothetical protein n=1 Tax=Endozoicomonas atrinae TaxID=1333660 RepID=UPI003AFFA3D2